MTHPHCRPPAQQLSSGAAAVALPAPSSAANLTNSRRTCASRRAVLMPRDQRRTTNCRLPGELPDTHSGWRSTHSVGDPERTSGRVNSSGHRHAWPILQDRLLHEHRRPVSDRSKALRRTAKPCQTGWFPQQCQNSVRYTPVNMSGGNDTCLLVRVGKRSPGCSAFRSPNVSERSWMARPSAVR